jgi:NAD(P)-dependent dehydrogenase (short-subunit alcohol dehydrogenase family)
MKTIDKLFSLKNRVIIITGAAGLLGQEHANSVAMADGIPILIDINVEKVNKLAKELNKKYGVEAVGYKVNITNEKEIIINTKKIISRYKKIDGLVNNAANNPKIEEDSEKSFSRLENFPENLWNEDISVGLTGTYLCLKHYGYQISKNSNGGSIVNISSDLGLIAPDQRLYLKPNVNQNNQPVKPVTYSVVKSGVIGLTRYVATYWADRNVRCNVICPGGVNNNQTKEFLEKIHKRIPMERLANSDEYQGTLIWMLSDASSYLNGAVIPVDGGRTAW